MTAELSRCVTNSTSNLTNIAEFSKRYLTFIGLKAFEDSLVTLVSMPKGRTYLIPGCYPFIVKVQRGYLEEFPIEENRYLVLKFSSHACQQSYAILKVHDPVRYTSSMPY